MIFTLGRSTMIYIEIYIVIFTLGSSSDALDLLWRVPLYQKLSSHGEAASVSTGGSASSVEETASVVRRRHSAEGARSG